MNSNRKNIRHSEQTNLSITIFDAESCSEKQKFARFRDTLASKGMPWRFEMMPDADFHARIISAELGSDLISRVQMTPLIGTRSGTEIANSNEDVFYVCYILHGAAQVEQDGRDACGIKRSLMIFDGSSPVKVKERAERSYDVFSLVVPKVRFNDLENANSLFRNISIPPEQLANPLAACLDALVMTLPTTSSEELAALYDASIILLPMAAGRRRKELIERMELIPSRYVRELLKFIEHNLGNAELSPGAAAEHFNVSVRYIHRQFAINGTTFGTYVMGKRLEGVRRDLVSNAYDNIPISALAFRWGFSDLSTFTRAFKKRFDCTPRECRRRG
ncbi:helix-turn-helix domain-containing protein [Hyphomicrobium sp. B1]|uniref:helix-turn-helix domain-containing protein n=1 Tax=unclassified Hyphomicrobium TaxID=2619925 RepID=UPI001AFBDFFF|nr:Orf1 [Hyphomicrobium sp.]